DGELFRINLGSGVATSIITFPSGGEFFTSLTADINGVIFSATLEGSIFSYDVSTGSVGTYDPMGFGASGDLTFYQGEMYMASTNNQLVKIDPEEPVGNSVFIDFSSVNSTIFGIVSYADGCDVRTYAFSNDNDARVYEIDWENATFTFICEISERIYGGASEFEFDASNTPIIIEEISRIQTTCTPPLFDIEVVTTSENGGLEFSLDGINFQSQNVFNDINPGSYTLYVTDDFGCETDADFSVQDGAIINIDTLIISPTSCSGNGDGSIQIEASSTNGGVQYSFNGGPFQGNNNFTDLSIGVYSITIEDALGCQRVIQSGIQEKESVIIESANSPRWRYIATTCEENNGYVVLEEVITLEGGVQFSLDESTWFDYPEQDSIGGLSPGSYILYLMDDYGCVEELSFVIVGSASVDVLDISSENPKCAQATGRIEIIATSNAEINYSIGTETNNTGIFENLTAGTYLVQATVDGCSPPPVELTLEEDCQVYVPNAFSPNEDGFNDILKVYGQPDVKVSKLQIFDRWGSIIYEGRELDSRLFTDEAGWDGTSKGVPVPNGVYVYLVTFQSVNGRTQFSGDVTLLR
ncbi:MAG: gliding motility-associated C-terminal domain-containing protein, partial [Saprospiraceae bacterium]